ncbi:hypothetical protein OHT57_15885 [Streptomyces sp. NBC_00285]|nr:hypothetical protein [Streptomyces sp. NBC_00285]
MTHVQALGRGNPAERLSASQGNDMTPPAGMLTGSTALQFSIT